MVSISNWLSVMLANTDLFILEKWNVSNCVVSGFIGIYVEFNVIVAVFAV